MGMNDMHSLSHTKWDCKYHIVFAPKYRREAFYKEKKAATGKILRQLCERKGVHIIEAEVCSDHIHMLVEIPPKQWASSFMGYLKGKSSTMLYEQFGEPKYINTGIENFGAVGTMWTRRERTRDDCGVHPEPTERGRAGRTVERSARPARSRAAKNRPYAFGRPHLCVHASVRDKGLCPHLKYPRLRRWIFI